LNAQRDLSQQTYLSKTLDYTRWFWEGV